MVDLNKVSGFCPRGRETDWSRPTHIVYFKHPAHLDHYSGDREYLRRKLFPSTIYYISSARDLGESAPIFPLNFRALGTDLITPIQQASGAEAYR